MIASNHSILIIDDEDIVRESVAAYLEDSGYRI
jgi:CheY-like chemotaxis protein